MATEKKSEIAFPIWMFGKPIHVASESGFHAEVYQDNGVAGGWNGYVIAFKLPRKLDRKHTIIVVQDQGLLGPGDGLKKRSFMERVSKEKDVKPFPWQLLCAPDRPVGAAVALLNHCLEDNRRIEEFTSWSFSGRRYRVEPARLGPIKALMLSREGESATAFVAARAAIHERFSSNRG